MNIVQNFEDVQKDLNNLNLNSKIIAVSKTFELSHIMPLIDSGHLIYGENRVQEAKKKWSEILASRQNLELHLIGGLQSNKAKDAVKLFQYIHSVDRKSLVDALFDAEKKEKLNRKYFIQVNTGDEDQKNGISIGELKDLFNYSKDKINVIGLMCIPPVNDNATKHFEILKNLRNKLNLSELSMGMSHDYLEAAKLGATYIRVGSKIFGSRD